MVLLVTTARILSALQSVSPSRRQALDLPDPTLQTPISHDQLIRLARHLQHASSSPAGPSLSAAAAAAAAAPGTSLNALLRGTKVYVPPAPQKPEPSPEYLALKARLLAAVERDAYARMMTPSNPRAPPSSLLVAAGSSFITAEQDADDPLTPSLVLSIFLSIVITGFSVYWALVRFATPDLGFMAVVGLSSSYSSSSSAKAKTMRVAVGGMSEPVRVLVSFLAALVVAVAESVLYAVYLRKVEQAKAREKRVRERKVVVASDEIGSSKVSGREGGGRPGSRLLDEMAEIWGRGANGGLRRRVREKWEEREGRERSHRS